MAANYGLLALLENLMPLAVAKLIVEAVLYPASFLLQRKFVFYSAGRLICKENGTKNETGCSGYSHWTRWPLGYAWWYSPISTMCVSPHCTLRPCR